MQHLVSVIMPVYNVRKYIDESIRSVQAQTYTNWELLVINDGSTDNTESLAQELASKDSRIRIINQPNSGVSHARNKGLELAMGKYISFLDGDDRWEPTFLEELVRAKEHANVDIAYCGYDHLYMDKFRRKYRYQYPSGRILADAIKGIVRIHIGAILVDKSILEIHNLRFTEDCPIAEDWEFIAKILTYAVATAVPHSLLLYRVRAGSALNARWDWQKHIHALWVQDRLTDFVRSNIQDPTEQTTALLLLTKATAYKTYRFFWRMIKNGYLNEARALINQPRYAKYLKQVKIDELKPVDRLKYRLVTSKNRLWWKLVRTVPI